MRTLTDADRERLNAFLCGLGEDAMVFEELDGYLAGVIVCPELIAPGEWLSQVWGEDGSGFKDLDEANEILEIVMALYNDIVHSLNRPGAYLPRLDKDRDGTTIWELWASGFGRALDLRPWAWADYDDRPEDDPDAMAIRVLDTLARVADTPGGGDLSEEIERSLGEDAGQILGACVENLHRARLAALEAQRAKPVGRNDPCPCGSGKKYKKCCLQAQNP